MVARYQGIHTGSSVLSSRFNGVFFSLIPFCRKHGLCHMTRVPLCLRAYVQKGNTLNEVTPIWPTSRRNSACVRIFCNRAGRIFFHLGAIRWRIFPTFFMYVSHAYRTCVGSIPRVFMHFNFCSISWFISLSLSSLIFPSFHYPFFFFTFASFSRISRHFLPRSGRDCG